MITTHGGFGADLAVRRATADDVPVLVALMEEFYAESSHPLDRPWATSSFMALVSTPAWGCVWLAHCGSALGHVVLTVRYAMEHGGLIGHVDDLFVRPAFRRRGVARALLAELLQECRERRCQAVHVEVGHGNAAALRAYAGVGLTPRPDGRLLLTGAIQAASLSESGHASRC